MPTILRFDDPALVGTLAAQAGAYAVNQDQQRLALQQQQQADQYALGRARLDQQAGGFRSAGVPTAAAPQLPGGTEVLPNGATVYHPPGSAVPQSAGPQPAAGGRGGIGRLGQYMPGGGYVSPLQRQMSDAVDQMEDAGQLDPAEAVRFRMQIAAGKNPFEQPTAGEQMRVKARTDRADTLTQYQRSLLEDKTADNARADQDRRQKDDDRSYDRERDGLRAELDVLTKRRTEVLPGQDTAKIDGQIDGILARMKDLAKPKPAAAAGGAAVAGGSTAVAAARTPSAPAAPPAAAAPAGGQMSVTAGRPMAAAAAGAQPSRADVTYLVQRYGSAAAAREAWLAGERAPGR